mmetsp:Transcript_36289/g.108827  ORF Transcript_36289/g.108827 Transcript_36289/m.108827 type:complete len:241 (-) Transcript_36289:749-1471(-)
MPGLKMAIFTAGSAMRAVAMGIHTPAVTRSTSTGAVVALPLSSSSTPADGVDTSNMLSLSLSTPPNVDPIDAATSSNKLDNPAHSPLDPPSSSRPMDTFVLTRGMMATRAKADSASLPRPRRANPRRQCPTMRSSRDSAAANEEVAPPAPSTTPPSSSLSLSPATLPSISSSTFSSLAVSDRTASLSSRRMRGANFIRNFAFSASSGSGVRIDGRAAGEAASEVGSAAAAAAAADGSEWW